jgi:hypothetical protein
MTSDQLSGAKFDADTSASREDALDEALGMTFPASDPIASFQVPITEAKLAADMGASR